MKNRQTQSEGPSYAVEKYLESDDGPVSERLVGGSDVMKRFDKVVDSVDLLLKQISGSS